VTDLTIASDQVTRWLADWRHSDAAAVAQFVDAVHPELQKIAARHLGNVLANHTLEPNALVHEL
jgi:hypothetical protein